MSLGYAERLSYREDLGGRLGAPEILEHAQEVLQKVEQFTDLVRAANKIIAFTGAGISTACGIPDFRGPNGVWTLQRQGKPLPKAKVSFLYAQPSLTHMALLGLMQGGKLKYICSQNVDSLHLRSGVPRSEIAELHGNCFAERCKKCKAEYVRDFEMDTVGFKPTGRMCSKPRCTGHLVDHILDWEDALPPAELKATEQHASAADVSICLGTSLQIIPAANLPLRTVKAGGSLAIINLQATPKDKHAAVVIHAKVDQVMAILMQRLGLQIPAYVRTDRLLLSHKALPAPPPDIAASCQAQQQPGPQQQQAHAIGSWSFKLIIASVHGAECPLPMVASARVAFYDQSAVAARATQQPAGQQAAAAAGALGSAAAAPAQPDPVDLVGLQEVLPAQEVSGAVPWEVQRTVPGGLQQVAVVVALQFMDAADADRRKQQVHYIIKKPHLHKAAASQGRGTRGAKAKQRQQEQQPNGSEVVSFVTQLRDYRGEQQELVASLLQAAGMQEHAVQPTQQPAAPAAAAAPAPARPADRAEAGPAPGSAAHSKQQDTAADAHTAAGDAAGVVVADAAAEVARGASIACSSPCADEGSTGGLEAAVAELDATAEQHAAQDGSDRPSKRPKQGDCVA